jgi:hypothetical protein
MLTWISDADSDVTTLEIVSVEGQSLLDTLSGCKFGITEALWLHLQLVFNDSNTGALAASKEVLDISNGGVEREVAEMDGVWWLIRKRDFLADGVT